jgi:urea transporter
MFKTPGSGALYDRLETGAYLILIGLLSLGLWAAIWAIAASLI